MPISGWIRCWMESCSDFIIWFVVYNFGCGLLLHLIVAQLVGLIARASHSCLCLDHDRSSNDKFTVIHFFVHMELAVLYSYNWYRQCVDGTYGLMMFLAVVESRFHGLVWAFQWHGLDMWLLWVNASGVAFHVWVATVGKLLCKIFVACNGCPHSSLNIQVPSGWLFLNLLVHQCVLEYFGLICFTLHCVASLCLSCGST